MAVRERLPAAVPGTGESRRADSVADVEAEEDVVEEAGREGHQPVRRRLVQRRRVSIPRYSAYLLQPSGEEISPANDLGIRAGSVVDAY